MSFVVDARVTVRLPVLPPRAVNGQRVVNIVGDVELLTVSDQALAAPAAVGSVNLQRWYSRSGADPLFDDLAALSPGDVVQVRGTLTAASRPGRDGGSPVAFFRLTVDRAKGLARAKAEAASASVWS